MNAFDILMMVTFLFIQNWSITSTDQHLASPPPNFMFGRISRIPTYRYVSSFFFFLMVILRFDIFIHVFLAGLGLCCCAGFSPGVVLGLLTAGLLCRRARALRLAASAVMLTGSAAAAAGL